MSAVLHRTISPVLKVLSEHEGIVRVIASDESLDSDREIVRPRGWKFADHIPLLDSHQRASVRAQLGIVIEHKVRGGQLIADAKYAIDVPENELARFRFGMIKAGYGGQYSVGFTPHNIVQSGHPNFKTQCRECKADPALVSRIFDGQTLNELSDVNIGANRSTVAQAWKAGFLSDSELNCAELPESDLLVIKSAGRSARRVSVNIPFPEVENPPTMKPPHSTRDFLRDFERLTGRSKRSIEGLSKALRTGTDSEVHSFHRLVAQELCKELCAANGDPIGKALTPENRVYLNAIARKIAFGARAGDFLGEEHKKALGEDSSPGSTLISAYLPPEIYSLFEQAGAYSRLGVVPILSETGLFAVATARAAAKFAVEGDALPEDSALTGAQVSDLSQIYGALFPISEQLLQDMHVDISRALADLLLESLPPGLDYACFQGNGTLDQDNGGIDGILPHADIATVTAAAGGVTVQQLDEDDILSMASNVAPGALTSLPKFFVAASLVGPLLQVRDGSGRRLLRTMLEDGGDELFTLAGFGCVASSGMPSTNAAGATVLLFGHGPAYAVGVRQEAKLELGGAAGWNKLQKYFRATGRATGKMRRGAAWAKLKTASV